MANEETKARRFERIAERRVNQTLRALRLLGNLADRKNYEYSEEQVTLLLAAIDRGHRVLKSRFKAEIESTGSPFRFTKAR